MCYVAILQGFDDEALAALVTHSKTLKAIVLLAYGTGNSPNKREGFLNFVREAARRRIVIVCITQCTQGGVSLGTYAVGRELKSLGVVSGGDLTTEAAVTKLAYLFARLDSPEAVAVAMMRNLRGELSPADTYTHALLCAPSSSSNSSTNSGAAAVPVANSSSSSSGVGGLSRLWQAVAHDNNTWLCPI
eukprot:13018-Heterococcus_DN1.PRE.1